MELELFEKSEEMESGICATRSAMKRASHFYDITSSLLEGDGKPQTINLCRHCYNLRLAERGESNVTNPDRRSRSTIVKGMMCSQNAVGKIIVGEGNESCVAGDKQLARLVTVEGGALSWSSCCE